MDGGFDPGPQIFAHLPTPCRLTAARRRLNQEKVAETGVWRRAADLGPPSSQPPTPVKIFLKELCYRRLTLKITEQNAGGRKFKYSPFLFEMQVRKWGQKMTVSFLGRSSSTVQARRLVPHRQMAPELVQISKFGRTL